MFRLESETQNLAFSYDTSQAMEICRTIERHCSVLQEATHARAIVDFQGAIQFQVGDLIKVNSKNVSPGWY